jgi:hypothetical protein
VRRGIVAANRAVPPFANHLVVMNQHRADGHFTLVPGALSQRKRVAHPVFMIVFSGGQGQILQLKAGGIIHTRSG